MHPPMRGSEEVSSTVLVTLRAVQVDARDSHLMHPL